MEIPDGRALMEREPADLVILSVKYTALDQAIKDIRNQVGEHTVIMSLLNGVESEERIKAAYPDNEVLYSVIRVSGPPPWK